MQNLKITSRDALIIVDMQNDFLPGGSLGVPEGDMILPAVEELARMSDNIVLTQDWHPAGHKSFASSHDSKAAFDMVEMPYGDQVLWPDHCVQGTFGAEFRLPQWVQQKAQLIIRKGFRPEIDSYSAFIENDKTTSTGLKGYLDDRGIERVILAGIATDFCVGWSAIDAINLGLEAVVVLEACRGIAEQSINERTKEMKAVGTQFV